MRRGRAFSTEVCERLRQIAWHFRFPGSGGCHQQVYRAPDPLGPEGKVVKKYLGGYAGKNGLGTVEKAAPYFRPPEQGLTIPFSATGVTSRHGSAVEKTQLHALGS